MNILDLKEYINGKRVLHTTHKLSDCDGIASIYWGINVFGGDYYIPHPELRSGEGLIDFLNLKTDNNINFDSYDIYFIYDTSNYDDIDFLENKEYVIFDHHSKINEDFVSNSVFAYINNASANVINLYELSIKNSIHLKDEILLSFATALYTDTLMFRTAREKEFYYFSKFIKNKKFEDILNIIYSKNIDQKDFINSLKEIKLYNINDLIVSVCYFNDVNQYQAFLDGLLDILGIDVSIGILPLGIKIQVKKIHVQKIYHQLLVPLQKKLNIKKQHGVWLNFFDYNLILESIKKGDK
jgi:nanoRNase/pAp phosphatase (c-di-AMP/oligoRNAs hydrolase)